MWVCLKFLLIDEEREIISGGQGRILRLLDVKRLRGQLILCFVEEEIEDQKDKGSCLNL